jgi:hypothetical protein
MGSLLSEAGRHLGGAGVVCPAPRLMEALAGTRPGGVAMMTSSARSAADYDEAAERRCGLEAAVRGLGRRGGGEEARPGRSS